RLSYFCACASAIHCTHLPPLLHSSIYIQQPGQHPDLHSFPTRRSSDLPSEDRGPPLQGGGYRRRQTADLAALGRDPLIDHVPVRSEEHTSELQSRVDLVCRLLLEKKKVNDERVEMPSLENRETIDTSGL